jgi:hypothetical protein
MSDAEYRDGLSSATSVGPAGLYRKMAEEDILLLGTVAWRAGWFTTTGNCPSLLFRPDLPERYELRQLRRSWTGKTVACTWQDEGWEMELRETLPGPLWRLAGRELSLWFAYPNEPRHADDLEAGLRIGLRGGQGIGRVYLLNTPSMPTLVVTSAPVAVSVVSHRHWRLRFAEPGGGVLAVPLLQAGDVPDDADRQELWKRLVDAPPLDCRERFAVEGDAIRLLQQFPDAELSPRSCLLENALQRTSLLAGSAGRRLCATLLGPYAVHEGDAVETRIGIDWMDYAAVPTRQPAGELSELPEQLAFHGDVTWDEATPMDRLMSWRVWGPLVGLMDDRRRRELLDRLIVPTPAQWRGSLDRATEPACGRSWAFDRTVFADSGDTCYDADWYNGLMLSGLDRACRCAEPAVADAAATLAWECKAERAEMLAYYEVYHDWRFSCAWTDAFGTLWNIDCAQNGLEGLLGEMRLRRREGDGQGADWVRYLAATSAAGMLSATFLPDWLRETGIELGDVPMLPQTVGIKGIYPHIRIGTVDPFTKNPYLLPRYFPAYSALLKLHGPVERLRELAETWRREFPQRYADWRAFYQDPEIIDRMRPRNISIDHGGIVCEVGDWAAAMHHVFPESALRVWVLGESPDDVEAMHTVSLPLAEQLILRSGMELRPVGEAEDMGTFR